MVVILHTTNPQGNQMSTYTYPRITATNIHPAGNSAHATCHRCGIDFSTRHRARTDRTHCRDCRPYLKGTN